MISDATEFREDTSVYFKEFFGSGSIQEEHLESTNFETFTQNSINDFASISFTNNVGLNNDTSTVVEESSSLFFFQKKGSYYFLAFSKRDFELEYLD